MPQLRVYGNSYIAKTSHIRVNPLLKFKSPCSKLQMDFLDEEDIQSLLYLKPLNLLHLYGNRREIQPIIIPQNKEFPKGNKPNFVLSTREDAISNRPIIPNNFEPNNPQNAPITTSQLLTTNVALNHSEALLALQGFNPFENEERIEYTEYLRDCIRLKTFQYSEKLFRFKGAALFHMSKVSGFANKTDPIDSGTLILKEFTKLYSNQRSFVEFQPTKELCRIFKVKFKVPAADESATQSPQLRENEEIQIEYDYSAVRPNQSIFDALFGEDEEETARPDFTFSMPSVQHLPRPIKRETSLGSIGFKKRRIKK